MTNVKQDTTTYGMNLRQDPTRTELPETGVFVRAQVPDVRPEGRFFVSCERWDSVDVNHLDRESLVKWMDDKDKPYLMSLVLFLLNHTREPDEVKI